MYRIILTLALAVTAVPATAMTVGEFMAKVDALKAKGPMALFSSDIGRLKAEGQAAGQSIRQDQEAALGAGRKPATCVPKGSRLKQDELLGYFGSLPPARRAISVKQGMTELVRKKWPCPA